MIEPNAGELVLERSLDFADVITNQAELDIGRASLQQIFEGVLGVFCHIIHFVQNDEFRSDIKQIAGFDKGVDLIANNVNASLVGRIQMDNEPLVALEMPGLEFIDEIDNRSRLARSRGAIQ